MSGQNKPGTVQVIGQVIPPELADQLRAERASGGAVGELLAAAYFAGWTQAALAVPLGMVRQRVNQLVTAADAAVAATLVSTIPAAPRWPETPGRRQRQVVPEDIAVELRSMFAVAKAVNGSTPTDDPSRKVSVEFARSLFDLTNQGFNYKALARAVGCTHNAIRFRIGRHGHREPAPSQRDQYVGRAWYDTRPSSISPAADVAVV